MLFLAAYKDKRVREKRQLIEIKRGQLVGSISYFKERWGTNKDKVIDFLKLLESDGMILKSTDKNITIITICNYENYQDCPNNSSDNLSNNLSDRSSDTVPTQFRHLSEQNKESKEINNINITTAARTREDGVGWDESVENEYLERFKAQGSARDAMRMTGKTLREVMEIMDVYRAKRKLQNRGHESYDQFCNLFVWYLEQGKIPQTSAQPQSGVISGQAIFDRIK